MIRVPRAVLLEVELLEDRCVPDATLPVSSAAGVPVSNQANANSSFPASRLGLSPIQTGNPALQSGSTGGTNLATNPTGLAQPQQTNSQVDTQAGANGTTLGFVNSNSSVPSSAIGIAPTLFGNPALQPGVAPGFTGLTTAFSTAQGQGLIPNSPTSNPTGTGNLMANDPFAAVPTYARTLPLNNLTPNPATALSPAAGLPSPFLLLPTYNLDYTRMGPFYTGSGDLPVTPTRSNTPSLNPYSTEPGAGLVFPSDLAWIAMADTTGMRELCT